MYSSNYHSHCNYCDGRGSMEDFVRFAISHKLKKYGFSSHAPLSFHTSWTMNADDFDDYLNEFIRLKQKYKHHIELFLGLEADYIEGCSDVTSQFFKNNKFDYLISSVHYLDKLKNGNYWSIDGQFSKFDEGLTEMHNGDIKSATIRFFEVTFRMIEKGGFDIVGHVDKIMMHASKYPEFSLGHNWYIDLMMQTLELIKQKNLLLEINTKSLKEHGYIYPHKYFLPRIKELNIPLVLSSDCHYPDRVNIGFNETITELKNAGIGELYEIAAGKWTAVEI